MGHLSSPPVLIGFVLNNLSIYVVCWFFGVFSFGHCIVCPVIYASDYPFSTFKLVFQNEILRQMRWFKFSHCDPFICRNIPAAPAYGVYRIFQWLQFLSRFPWCRDSANIETSEHSVSTYKVEVIVAIMTWLLVAEYMCHKWA